MALYHLSMKSDRKPNGDKIMADDHADYNNRDGKYKDIDDQEMDVNAADHADYINRDAAFAGKGGCVYKAHHLPKWANESAKEFFAAAATHEESEHTYKELEFALQNELTLKQNLEIIQSFIEKNFSDYYYAYAIHSKEATLGNGKQNPHCHFMFSMRKMDDLEKEQERAPECFFKKARRVYEKKDGTVTDNRRLGGCKVPDCWNKFYASSDNLRYLRKDFAQATNNVLEKYHIPARVDHRSNKDRYEEALKENDEFRAQLYALPPEQHLGPAVASNPNDPRVIALKEQRKLRYETIRMIEGISRLEHLADDHRLAEKQKNLTTAAAEVADSTREILVDETILCSIDKATLDSNCTVASSDTDAWFTSIRSFSDTLLTVRRAEMTPQELAEESALRQICQEKAALQKEYTDLEAREKSLRAMKVTALMKQQPDYNALIAIKQADTDDKTDDVIAMPNAPILLAKIQSDLSADAEYIAIQTEKTEIATKLNASMENVAAQTQRMREINLRLNTPENKQKLQAEALRLFAESKDKRIGYQESSLHEISLLKQKIQITGTKIAVLQEDVILYRQAIEVAKESYLKELKANAETTLPEIEEKIKAKYANETMQPLPLPEETHLLYLEKQRDILLEQKEYLPIFQQNKIVTQETFELKKELQQLEKQKKKASAPEIQTLELHSRELMEKLEKSLDAKKECREKMQDIRKLFATKEAKSALTEMANDITQGDIPKKQTVEALQSEMMADVERTRTILLARIRLMNEQAIADRLADANLSDAFSRQRRKTERRYTAIEVRKTIYDILAAIRVEKQAVEKQLAPLEERYVSEARARKMAIDIYTENKTKDLRKLNYAIKKKEGQLRKADEELLTKEYSMLNTKKPKWYDRALGNITNKQYTAAQQEISGLKQQSAQDKAALYSLQTKASQTEFALNSALKAPEAAAKIEQITNGILKKNQLVADQVFALRAKKSQLTRQTTEFTQLASAATRQIEADRGRNITYAASIGGAPKSKSELAALIAKAFDGSNIACAAVTRIDVNDQSVLDWEGKDTAERKAEQRESAWNRGEF